MKLHSIIGMPTDHDFYGRPIETSRVETWISEDVEWSTEMLEELDSIANIRLHAMAKRMPFSYFRTRPAELDKPKGAPE